MAQTSSNFGDITKDPLTLEEILIVFNNPVNEEQAWAVCYQCARHFTTNSKCKYRDLHAHGMRAVRVKKDGDIFIEFSEISRGTGKGPPAKRRNSVTGKDIKTVTEHDAIPALGMVLFHALDYGVQESEERHLSRDLEHLLEVMINPDEEDEESQNADDEGIEKDAKEGYTFHDILNLCEKHLSNEKDAGHHYKAVCRALVAEVEELFTFLNKISSGQEKLAREVLDEDQARLEELQRSDWARLWVQIMRELRRGVRLKKVEHTSFTPTEYELTPFEILLEDIRTRRYSLNKVMVNGDIPPKVKSDAHAVILNFIRSRPPLHPMKERVLKSPPKRDLHPREKLMLDIRSQPKLRPVRDGKLLVETSRTKLNNESEIESPQPVKKVIKPDFHLFLDSFDESETDDSSAASSRRSSITSPSPERDVTRWRRAVVRDVVTADRHGILTRRNSIAVCESPGKVSATESAKKNPESASDAKKSDKHNNHNKLRRSSPLSKSHACANDIRSRLSQKLHGIDETSENSDSKQSHDSACSKSTQDKLSDDPESPDNDYVFDRSKGLRMPIPRRLFNQRLQSDSSMSEEKSKSEPRVQRAASLCGTASTGPHVVEVRTRPVPVQRKSSITDSRERPRPMVRSNSAAEIKPQVSVVPHSLSCGNEPLAVSSVYKEERKAPEPRPRPRPAPRRSKSNAALKTSLDTTQKDEQSTQKVEQSTQKVEQSTQKVEQSTQKVEQSTQKVEQSTRKVEQSTQQRTDIPSPLPVSPRQPLLPRERSSLSPKKSPLSPRQLQMKGSDNGSSFQFPDPIQIDSNGQVQRRVRPQIVHRSQSHKFHRHSTDFSGSRAISEIGEPTRPKNRSIMLGRHRKEAEELVKPPGDKDSLVIEIKNNSESDKSESPSSTVPKFSELNVNDLLHVSWTNPPLIREDDVTNRVSPTSPTSTDSDSAKQWTHPIECLALTLEEVTHIRTVLTKAELETLLTNQELYNLVSKGKVCFTCKDVKFSMFGQWGTKCKICKRTVCNNCLRKMNIPTEHFESIPVHTLSPIPLSQETVDMLKVFESTGSVPPTPAIERKQQQTLENKSAKSKPLQRSHTIGSGTPPTLPNKNLLRGPQMNVCCDCKSMIMEIIRTSRTSIALVNQRKAATSPKSSPLIEKEHFNVSSLSLNIKQFFSK